mmetsp:Transcript_42191/g.75567  ORF Transcript_42191/g.75567 Transcript_42191/m.75567 type:complete len:260 (-) Transcript_42191:525-1304(-)
MGRVMLLSTRRGNSDPGTGRSIPAQRHKGQGAIKECKTVALIQKRKALSAHLLTSRQTSMIRKKLLLQSEEMADMQTCLEARRGDYFGGRSGCLRFMDGRSTTGKKGKLSHHFPWGGLKLRGSGAEVSPDGGGRDATPRVEMIFTLFLAPVPPGAPSHTQKDTRLSLCGQPVRPHSGFCTQLYTQHCVYSIVLLVYPQVCRGEQGTLGYRGGQRSSCSLTWLLSYPEREEEMGGQKSGVLGNNATPGGEEETDCMCTKS